jgi:uncharacterized membrane protein
MSLLSIAESLSRFHPLIVHLPIGILLFAFFLTLLPAEKRDALSPAMSYALLITAVSAVMAAITGYLLSRSGEYDEALVQKHQWAGIATSVIAVAAMIFRKWQRPLTWLAIPVMAFAGHQGGVLTHGEGYLFGSQPQEEKMPSAPPADTVVIKADSAAIPGKAAVAQQKVHHPWLNEVRPILEAKCFSCHSALKRKGGLRLDEEAFIRKGGKNGPVMVSGDPTNSKLYTYLLLPEDDEMHMPPRGKRQLAPREIDAIQRWIRSGSPFGEVPLESSSVPAMNMPAVMKPELTAVESESPAVVEPVSPAAQPEAGPSIPAADESLLASLRERQVIITHLTGKENGLGINLVNAKMPDAGTMSELSGLRDQTVQLKLTGQPVQDEDLRSLGQLPNLTHLQLERTLITDDAIAVINGYTRLEQLNLYGTAVTDKGLAQLARNKKLKKLYLWNTNVSSRGVKALQQANPGLRIETGDFRFTRPDTIRNQ